MRARTLSALAVIGGAFPFLTHTPQDQKQDPAKTATPRPVANPADVASLDSILGALYACISGPVGQARDFARMRSLFADGARLMPTRAQGEGFTVRSLSVDDYIAVAGENLVKHGFRESELTRRVEQFGAVAHAWSTYVTFRGEGKEPIERGINSVQLSFDGERWWVQNILWMGENEKHPIPAAYLPPAGEGKGK